MRPQPSALTPKPSAQAKPCTAPDSSASIPPRANSPKGVAAQTEQSLKNIRALLTAAGAGVENVVKTTVFITNMVDFPLVNTEYSKVFAENPPARSCVAVKELPLGGLVEIEVLAVV